MTLIRVLLADDHAVVLDGLRVLLEQQGDIRVVATVSNGIEAVQQTLREHPHVVLMDIAMPLLNGIEATQQIRELHPQTQVVILSIHAAWEHIHRALEAGALGYLLKESAGNEVVTAVRTVYKGDRYLSQKVADIALKDFGKHAKWEDPLRSLSARERQVLRLVVEGKTSAEAAEILSLSPKSVETYRRRIMHKLGLHDLPSLVKFAIQHGVISLE
ncbi:MAG TPA: response regulator transcription factor [Anaerolineales bacterium]|nr:response regulator transcription factor [Anaerolineales bacterium]